MAYGRGLSTAEIAKAAEAVGTAKSRLRQGAPTHAPGPLDADCAASTQRAAARGLISAAAGSENVIGFLSPTHYSDDRYDREPVRARLGARPFNWGAYLVLTASGRRLDGGLIAPRSIGQTTQRGRW